MARLLDGPRAQGAFLLRAALVAPWSMRVQDEAPLTIAAVLRGNAVVLPDDGEPRQLAAGDVIVLRGPGPYTLADDPATVPQVLVNPDQDCVAPDGQPLKEMRHLGVRTWGNNAQGETTLLVGTYQLDGEVSRRLLAALPSLLVVPAQAQQSPLVALVALLAAEVVEDEPGQEAVLDRLLDLVLITRLRGWLARGSRGRRRGAPQPAIRSSAGRSSCCTTLRRSRGRSPPWPARPGCPGRRWLAGSPCWWASRRCRSSPAGGWRWRRPAARARSDAGRRGDDGRLRQCVLAQRRVQARARDQPQRAPRRRRRDGDLSRARSCQAATGSSGLLAPGSTTVRPPCQRGTVRCPDLPARIAGAIADPRLRS